MNEQGGVSRQDGLDLRVWMSVLLHRCDRDGLGMLQPASDGRRVGIGPVVSLRR